jgi:hypothetical protein
VSTRPATQLARPILAVAAGLIICAAFMRPALARPEFGAAPDMTSTDPVHVLISEVMTGGSSASDEFAELYNPGDVALGLDGLELIYVSASGATVTRKAAWATSAAPIQPGAHLLIANEAGAFAPIADVTYANGLAATGGSLALRVQGATTAIDAVGWGTAANTWLEGEPARPPAPPAGSSLERLPGGPSGSGQDTQNNAVDFFIRATPDPQNSASPPTPGGSPAPTTSPTASATASATATATATATASPSPTPVPTSTPTPSATPSPSLSATPSPSPSATPTPTLSASATPSPSTTPITIAAARALPDGSSVTVSGLAISASDFTEGGGYLVDATAGIAVLVSDGSFPRGALLAVTGTIDDRYSQRTIRAVAADLHVTGTGTDPAALSTPTGGVGEAVEALLIQIRGQVIGSPTELSSGLAYDLDDGTGVVRVLVGPATGIDTSGWTSGTQLTVIGIVGQRDSSGSGSGGYRVQPRDPADVTTAPPSASPSPTPEPSSSPTATPTPTPTPSPVDPLMSIAQARQQATGTHLRLRGVVTVGSGLIEPGSAIVQDASAAILIRLDDEAGTLHRGQLVELDGVRSTRSGMLTLRVETRPLILGQGAEPEAPRVQTGSVAEAHEARLVSVRGAITSTPLRSTANNVSFTIDDGSGPLRIVLLAQSGISSAGLARDDWVEVRGAIGQETTGAQPARGYRVWPRGAADIRVLAGPAGEGAGTDAGNEVGVADAGGAGTIAGGSRGITPDLNATARDMASSGAVPGLSGEGPDGRNGDSGKDGSTTAADAAPASLRADTARRQTAALLLVGLALLVLVASAAWWSGAFRRLHAFVFAAPAGNDPADQAWSGAMPACGAPDAVRAPLAVLPAERDRDGP